LGAGRVLLALAAGLLVGSLGARSGNEAFAKIADGIGLFGTLWINAIRMTVVPLVAALTVASVATVGEAGRVGKLGGRAVLVFIALLVTSGFWAVLAAPIMLGDLNLPADAATSMRESLGASASGQSAVAVPTLVQRLIEIVPVNPIKAAVDTAVLPVVVFSLLFGLALTHVVAERRDPVLAVCRSISDTMMILVGWILKLAPFGVFALALVLGLRAGFSSMTAIVRYLIVLSAVMFAFTLVLYPIAIIIGRISPATFFKGALPAQAVAFSTRSSLASLPAMIAGARDVFRLPSATTGFVLPLAVSVFRINVPMAWVVGLIFLGAIYGVTVTTGMLAMLVVTATLLSFSVPGIPSGSLFLLSPVLVQNGIPAEGVGILIALDAIPDMFKTLANVTAHMTSAVVVARADTSARATEGSIDAGPA
jgi:Na+/H+-dicarboxylate symporter